MPAGEFLSLVVVVIVVAGGLTQIIILINAQFPPTNLQQLYGSGGAQQLYHLNFAQQPSRWDPRLLNSTEFKWYTPNLIPHDNAYISLSGTYYYAKTNAYNEGGAVAALVSAPFQKYISPADSARDSGYSEADLSWKGNVTVAADERIVFKFQTSCRVYGAEEHPFPANLVTHPDGDPRLASCVFLVDTLTTVSGNNNFLAGVYFSITNKSIWAVYSGFNFIAKRRVGIRRSYNDIVDIAIEYNAATEQYFFYVSNQVVWIISNIGQLPPQDGVTKIDVGRPENRVQTRATVFSFDFGIQKCLDESDPWNQADTTRLVRVTNSDEYYGNSAFYDNVGLRSNNLWGQAVKMKLYSVEILRTSANVTIAIAGGAPLPFTYYSGVASGNANNNNYENNAYYTSPVGTSDWGEENIDYRSK